MNSPLSVYETGLRRGRVDLLSSNGTRRPLPLARWIGEHDAADESMLARCRGATLDIGCGPGRLTAALTRRGVLALGIDVSPVAVAMTRRRGALALRRDVFGAVPGENRWGHLLLADGNISIGGDPLHLLRRCRDLLSPSGTLLVDLEPPGSGLLIEDVRLEQSGRRSDAFRWCWLAVDSLTPRAAAAGLTVRAAWPAGTRCKPNWNSPHGEPCTRTTSWTLRSSMPPTGMKTDARQCFPDAGAAATASPSVATLQQSAALHGPDGTGGATAGNLLHDLPPSPACSAIISTTRGPGSQNRRARCGAIG